MWRPPPSKCPLPCCIWKGKGSQCRLAARLRSQKYERIHKGFPWLCNQLACTFLRLCTAIFKGTTGCTGYIASASQKLRSTHAVGGVLGAGLNCGLGGAVLHGHGISVIALQVSEVSPVLSYHLLATEEVGPPWITLGLRTKLHAYLAQPCWSS